MKSIYVAWFFSQLYSLQYTKAYFWKRCFLHTTRVSKWISLYDIDFSHSWTASSIGFICTLHYKMHFPESPPYLLSLELFVLLSNNRLRISRNFDIIVIYLIILFSLSPKYISMTWYAIHLYTMSLVRKMTWAHWMLCVNQHSRDNRYFFCSNQRHI